MVEINTLTENQRILYDLLVSGEAVLLDTLFAAINRTPGVYSEQEKKIRVNAEVKALNNRETDTYVVSYIPHDTYRLVKLGRKR